MTTKDNLGWLQKFTQGAVLRLLDDVSEEESLVRGGDQLMHIRWLTGHLVWSACMTLRTLGADSTLPPAWVALFDRGAPFNEDDAAYPTMSDLRDELRQLHEQIGEHLAGIDTADLEKTLDSDPIFEDTDAVRTAFFLCTHDFYHAGQVAVMRRILGRERPFG